MTKSFIRPTMGDPSEMRQILYDTVTVIYKSVEPRRDHTIMRTGAWLYVDVGTIWTPDNDTHVNVLLSTYSIDMSIGQHVTINTPKAIDILVAITFRYQRESFAYKQS